MAFQTLAQQDFSKGVNAVASPYLVGQQQVVRARNLILDEHGSMRTRDGYQILTTSPDLVTPITYRGVLNKTDLSSTPFAIQGIPDVGGNTMYRTDTTPWTVVSTPGFDPTVPMPIPQSFTVVDREFIVCGYQLPRLYDGGVGLTPIVASGGQTVPPGAQHGAFHLGSVWLWNTAQTSSTLDGPSSLRMSDANNPNSWPNANQTFISKDDGQVGTGLASFTIAETGISPTQTLVAFKNYSGYQITGVFGSTNFAVQKIKSDMGCIAPRSIQFVSGFGIIRLTHKGFALYNGVDDKLISEEIRPYIFGKDELPGLSFSTISGSWAEQSQNPPLYLAACPIGGTGLSRLFIYDLVRKAWTIGDYPVELKTLKLFATPTISPVVHAGTYTGGQIWTIFNGATTDNAAAINWSLRTRNFYVGSFMRPTYWRRVAIDLAFSTSPQNISVIAGLTGLPSNITRTLTYTGSVAGAKWGTAIWNQFRWSGTSSIDGRRSFDIQRIAPSIAFSIDGTGPVTLRGLEIQHMPKPVNRQVI